MNKWINEWMNKQINEMNKIYSASNKVTGEM